MDITRKDPQKEHKDEKGGSEQIADGQVIDEQAAVDELPDIDVPRLLNDLALAQTEAEELRDRYLRLQAEWDNFRKRTAQEREAERERAAAHVFEKLLPIIDDLELAVKHSGTDNLASLQEGIKAVYFKLKDVFEKEGVRAVCPMQGEYFDPSVHEAVGTLFDIQYPYEAIMSTYQKGYSMGGRILRNAQVIVSQR